MSDPKPLDAATIVRTLPAGSRLTVERADDGTVKRVAFVASTAIADRADDIVDQASWRLDNYAANPVVQVDHDYSVEATVARGKVSVIEGVGLVLDVVRWSRKAEAQDVRQDVEDEIVNTVSVGFRPGRAVARKSLDPAHPYYKADGWGYAYFDCELLEVSIVAVPMNPEATALRSADRVSATDLADDVIAAIAADPQRRGLLAELLSGEADPAPDPLSHLFGDDSAADLDHLFI